MSGNDEEIMQEINRLVKVVLGVDLQNPSAPIEYAPFQDVAPSTDKGEVLHASSAKLSDEDVRIYIQMMMNLENLRKQLGNAQIAWARWHKDLPRRLTKEGASEDDWVRIRNIAEDDPKIQARLDQMYQQL